MIMDLGDGGHAQACIFKSVFDILGYSSTSLNAEQTHNRGKTVLDAVAHLPRQQRLVLKSLLQLRVCLLTFNGDAKQSGKTRQKVGVGFIKLAGVRAINFQYAEESFALTPLFYQDVDRAPDAVIRQELGCPEPGLSRQMVRDNRGPGLVGISGRRPEIGSERDVINGIHVPTNAGAHHQPAFVGQIFQDFRELGVEPLSAQFGGSLKNLPVVASLHRYATEFAEQGLLAQPVWKLIPIRRYRRELG